MDQNIQTTRIRQAPQNTVKNFGGKLLCQCPVCKEKIFGGHLGLNDINVDQIKAFPFSYTYCHGDKNQRNLHAITLYLDAQLKVRGVEASELLKISED